MDVIKNDEFVKSKNVCDFIPNYVSFKFRKSAPYIDLFITTFSIRDFFELEKYLLEITLLRKLKIKLDFISIDFQEFDTNTYHRLKHLLKALMVNKYIDNKTEFYLRFDDLNDDKIELNRLDDIVKEFGFVYIVALKDLNVVKIKISNELFREFNDDFVFHEYSDKTIVLNKKYRNNFETIKQELSQKIKNEKNNYAVFFDKGFRLYSETQNPLFFLEEIGNVDGMLKNCNYIDIIFRGKVENIYEVTTKLCSINKLRSITYYGN